MRSSLPSGKSATPPARCIHRPQRDTSSAEHRLLVSRASCGASRELSSRRSPALAPYTCAVSPTFRYGAFRFAAFALAALPSARLTTYDRKDTSARPQSDANPTLIDPICRRYHRRQMTPRQILRANRPFTTVPRGFPTVSSAVRSNIIEVPYDVNTDSFSSVASAISASTLLSYYGILSGPSFAD